MRLPDNARPGIAAISIGAFVYTVIRLARPKQLRPWQNDGPIRVKGGSVTVENPVKDWALDDDEWEADTSGANEHHSAGRSSNHGTSLLKYASEGQGTPGDSTNSLRQVVVHVREGLGSSSDLQTSLSQQRRAAGHRPAEEAERCEAGAAPGVLQNLTPSHWIEWVVVKNQGNTVRKCLFRQPTRSR